MLTRKIKVRTYQVAAWQLLDNDPALRWVWGWDCPRCGVHYGLDASHAQAFAAAVQHARSCASEILAQLQENLGTRKGLRFIRLDPLSTRGIYTMSEAAQEAIVREILQYGTEAMLGPVTCEPCLPSHNKLMDTIGKWWGR